MRKTLASVVIITFAGLLCMSLLATFNFNGSVAFSPQHLYFLAY